MKSGREHFDPIETWPQERLVELQWKQLTAVLRYAYKHLPFYRQRFTAAGIHPNDIKTFDDFRRIPLITKADLIHEISETQSCQIGIEALGSHPLRNIIMTSGTLGFHTFASLTPYELTRGGVRAVLREFWMQKMRPGMRVMTLSPGWHFLSLLDSRALTRMQVECLSPWGTHLPRFAGHFLDAVQHLRPAYLLTIPPVLYAMLGECERSGINSREVFTSVRYISAVGEPVTPQLRKKLKEELDLEDLFERGGSSDGLWGGGECFAHTGHHVFADFFYIEVIDPVRGNPLPPGERGTVVVTNLSLGKSLYIRFNCEDLATFIPGECPCGRTHPTIELFDRLTNTLTARGPTITIYDVRCCLDDIPALCGAPFFIVKQKDGSLRLELRGPQHNLQAEAELARHLLRERLGLEAVVAWTPEVPVRWKGRIVTEEEISGERRYPRE